MYIEKAQNQPALTENLQVKVPKLLALPTSTPTQHGGVFYSFLEQ